jgi:hypothetical protein
MRHTTLRLATTALIAATGLVGPAAPRALADSGPDAQGPSVLVMTVTPASLVSGISRSAVLECGPLPGGDHPSPAASCATLQTDGLDFTAKPTLQVMCPDLVQPVTVTATGVWNGTPVDYRHTYNNSCLMRRSTGELFDL